MSKALGPRKIRRYDDEFKVKEIRLSQFPGARIKDVAAPLIFIHSYCRNAGNKSRKMIGPDNSIVPLNSASK